MNKWEIYTDEELIKLFRDAVEMQDGKWINALKAEMNRRNREE